MKTIRYGSRGPEVADAQRRLNAQPSGLPRLNVDGIFGPKTTARTQEFQRSKFLVADGIIGPRTWAALPAVQSVLKPPEGILCGTGEHANQQQAPALKQALAAAFGASSASSAIAGFGRGGPGGGLPPFPGIGAGPFGTLVPSFSRLTPAQQTTARSVFGSSIDFSRVFISDKAGLQNRPFVVAIPIEFALSTVLGIPVGFIQIMNCGTLTPSTRTLIHELTHVWQSQHHDDKTAFMANAVKSQGRALKENLASGSTDPDVPWSAYAFIPGSPFGEYGAEQNARRVEFADPPARAHVMGVGPHVHDAQNAVSLSRARIQDRRVPGVRG